jgi:CheY-like chemotaxis protein
MIKKILLIEDDKKKIDDIKQFINSKNNTYDLSIKESYQSGLKELIRGKYDLLLLDMSLPTWESEEYGAVESFEKFGGYKIMKEMLRKQKLTKTILITMFDDFGESDLSITLSQIDTMLKESFNDFYLGYVFYNSKQSNWKDKLQHYIESI